MRRIFQVQSYSFNILLDVQGCMLIGLDGSRMSKSRQTRQPRNLGIQPRAEEILMNLANIPDFPPVGTVITPAALSFSDEKGRVHNVATDYRHVTSIALLKKRYSNSFGDCSEGAILAMRRLLRESWKSPDLHEREWFVFLLRKFHADTTRSMQPLQEDVGRYFFEKSKKPV